MSYSLAIICGVFMYKLWQVMSGSHKSPGDLLRDVCDGTIFEDNTMLRNNDRALQIIAYFNFYSNKSFDVTCKEA